MNSVLKKTTMKTLTLILIVLLSIQGVKAQVNTVEKEFWIENPVSKDKIKIEKGNKVFIRFRTPTETIQGTILAVSDSSVTLGTRRGRHRQIVPFRNISMIVSANDIKRIAASLKLENGLKLKGRFIRTTQDAVTVLTRNSLIYIGATEITAIRIRRKGVIWRIAAIGAGMGLIAGIIIGYDSHPIPPNGCLDPGCLEELFFTIEGGVIGSVAGAVAGGLIGLASGKRFEIEGSQTQFDVFANKFTEANKRP